MNRINFDASAGRRRRFCVISSEKWKNRKQFENVSALLLGRDSLALSLVPHISRLFAIASANLIYEVCLGLFCWLCESYGVYLKLLKGIFNDLDMLADAAAVKRVNWGANSQVRIDEIYNRVRMTRHTLELMMNLEFQTGLSHIPLLSWWFHLCATSPHNFVLVLFWHDEIYLLNSYSMMSRLGIVDRIPNKSIKNYVRGWNSSRELLWPSYTKIRIDKRDWTWQISTIFCDVRTSSSFHVFASCWSCTHWVSSDELDEISGGEIRTWNNRKLTLDALKLHSEYSNSVECDEIVTCNAREFINSRQIIRANN